MFNIRFLPTKQFIVWLCEISGWQTSPFWEIQDKAVQVESRLLLSSIVLYISGTCQKIPSVPLNTRIKSRLAAASHFNSSLKCTTTATKLPVWMKTPEISMIPMRNPKAPNPKHNRPSKLLSLRLQPSIITCGVIYSPAAAH